MIKIGQHILWVAILLSCSSLSYANDDSSNNEEEDQLQMSETQLNGPSVLGSLTNLPDTSIDTSNIDAARIQNQFSEQQRRDQIEAVLRQEQNDPELERQRARGSNENATGMMTPTGRERDIQNLTDAERLTKDEFIHEGRTERIYKEECRGDNTSVCDGNEDPNAKGILGLNPTMVEMMAKAYGLIVGFSGGDFKKKPEEKTDPEKKVSDKSDGDKGGKNAQNQKNTNNKKEDDTVKDYCKYIPVGIEGMAMLKQMTAQNDIQQMSSSSASQQRDSLLKAAKSHDERAKQAKIQATGWTATTACYVGYGTMAGIDPDMKYFLKLAGSALFSAHYWDSVDRHEDDADKTRAIANKLPSKGDCNPVTDRLCYCSEESTRNDPDFCMPQIRDRYVDKLAEFTTPCIDSKGKPDIECRCRDTNNCFDREIEDGLRGVGFSVSDLKGIRPVQELSRGSLSTSGFRAAQQGDRAVRNRIRKEFGKEISELANSRRLTPEQQNDADQLAQEGLPKPMAQLLASAPLNEAGQEKLAEMKRGGFAPLGQDFNSQDYSSGRSGSSIRTRGGQGLNPLSKKKDKSGNEFADMMKKLNGEDGRETASGGQVLRFAERAQNAAQISKREGTFLFDIISHRYQKSAWKRFDVDFDALPKD